MSIHPCARANLTMMRLQFQHRRLVPEDDPRDWMWYFPSHETSLVGYRNPAGERVELRAEGSRNRHALEFSWWVVNAKGVVGARISHHTGIQDALLCIPRAIGYVDAGPEECLAW